MTYLISNIEIGIKYINLSQMTQEIAIHRSITHKHIVAFHSFFEDSDNVYIILELCRRRVRDLINSKLIFKISVVIIIQSCFSP